MQEVRGSIPRSSTTTSLKTVHTGPFLACVPHSNCVQAYTTAQWGMAESDAAASSQILEGSPEFGKGPAILLIQTAADGRMTHCIWRIPHAKGVNGPAVVVNAYTPDPEKWNEALKVR